MHVGAFAFCPCEREEVTPAAAAVNVSVGPKPPPIEPNPAASVPLQRHPAQGGGPMHFGEELIAQNRGNPKLLAIHIGTHLAENRSKSTVSSGYALCMNRIRYRRTSL